MLAGTGLIVDNTFVKVTVFALEINYFKED